MRLSCILVSIMLLQFFYPTVALTSFLSDRFRVFLTGGIFLELHLWSIQNTLTATASPDAPEKEDKTCSAFVDSPFHVATPGNATLTPGITISNKAPC